MTTRYTEARNAIDAPESGSSGERPVVPTGGVDFIGLALDLDEREKTVESQTTKRAMRAASHGLRLMGAEIERLHNQRRELQAERAQLLERLAQSGVQERRAVAEERERWRAKLMAHRDSTVMSCYAAMRECEAARNALQRVLDDWS